MSAIAKTSSHKQNDAGAGAGAAPAPAPAQDKVIS